MPIVQAEIKFYRSATVSDAVGNGGRMASSATAITSGAVGNVFKTVGESERIAGSLKYRKIFAKVANAIGLALQEAKVYLDKYTLGDDIIDFFIGTQTNTQADITGSETKYGAGKLDANASATDTEIDVLVEDGATQPFQDGQVIRITDKEDIDDLAGSEEYVTIDGVPSVVGDVVTITFTPALENGYSASASRVMGVHEVSGGEVVAVVADVTLTSDDGTFDEENLIADNIGSIEQDWTLTWTSPTAFNIVGDTVGAQGAGSVGAGAAPNNANFSAPYFTIQAAGFGGTFEAGDTLEFSTHPAAVPIWLRRRVPAGADPLTVNEAVIVLDGETSA